MKAAVIGKYGSNDVVEIKDVPKPVPGPGEVLIRVRAASINPVDWKIRTGLLRAVTGESFPRVLGREGAGEVVAIGKGVKRFKTGDQVIDVPGIRMQGSYAEYVTSPEDSVYPKPANISFEEAATIPIAGLTALRALRDGGDIREGMKVLVNGAAGGVGHFAVQIAKILGADVTAVCSREGAPLVKRLGADTVIDYHTRDFTKGEERYDIIFDAVAKRTFEECRDVLTPDGVYVRTLPLSGASSEGGKKALTVPGGPTAEDMEWIRSRIREGAIRVVIDKVFSLDQVRDALAYSEAEHAHGKIVLKVA